MEQFNTTAYNFLVEDLKEFEKYFDELQANGDRSPVVDSLTTKVNYWLLHTGMVADKLNIEREKTWASTIKP
jgi:hypothetical protein